MNTETPKRIQRKRTKGWRMPPNTVSVTRPGEFGNMFKVGGYYRIGNGSPGFSYIEAHPAWADISYTQCRSTQQAVDMYEEYRSKYPLSQKQKEKLKGKNLACFCPLDKPCHADVLLKIANQ